MSFDSVEQEKKDLELHVNLCAQRYHDFVRKLDKIESKVDKIEDDIVEIKHAIDTLTKHVDARLATANAFNLRQYLTWANMLIMTGVGAIGWLLAKVLS